LSSYVDRKVLALEAYETEMRPAPHARAIAAVRSLAQLRGSWVGVLAAEAFVGIRQLRR
jgi:N-acetylglucosamine malate deacetylase 1